jgi:hypothetical protein
VLDRSLKVSSPTSQADLRRRPRNLQRTSLLSPNLIEALTGLAAVEDLPVATLIAVLINEALDRRLQRGRS